MLVVANGEVFIKPGACGFAGLQDDGRPGVWRVCVDTPGSPLRTLMVPFARKSDADSARIALAKAGLDDVEKLIAAGGPAVRRIMIEALAW